MDEEPKTDEESWAVELPKKDGSKKRKALRVALILAALAIVVSVCVLFGSETRIPFGYPVPVIRGGPKPVEPVDSETACAEDYGQRISGAEYGDE